MIEIYKKTINSKVEAALAQFFHENPTGKFYGVQLLKETGLSYAAIHKGLRSLRAKGFLGMQRQGREAYFQLDLGNPAVRAYRTHLNILGLEPLIQAIRDKCSKIVLYGSASAGTNVERSDVDVLAITDEAAWVLREANRIAEGKVSVAAKSATQIITMKARDPAFYENAVLKGLVLHENV